MRKRALRLFKLLSKNLTTRQIRLLVSVHLVSKFRYFRDKHACYGQVVWVEDLAAKPDAAQDFTAYWDLTEHQSAYYRAMGYQDHLSPKGDTLSLRFQEQIYVLPDCQLLAQTHAVLHKPTEKIVKSRGEKLERFDFKPFCYQGRTQVSGVAIPLLHNEHYYHFFIDQLLPMLRIIRSLADRHPVTVLVSSTMPAYQKAALDALAEGEAVDIQTVRREMRIDCDLLAVFSRQRSGIIDAFADGETLNLMRQKLHDWAEVSADPPSRRIYISRNQFKHRQMENESDVFAALQPLGFEMVQPERLSMREQIQLFASAECVIATAGAALTNLLFCKAGAKVIEIRPAEAVDPFFIGMSSQLGLEHSFLEGGQPGVHRRFALDPAALPRLVDEIGLA